MPALAGSATRLRHAPHRRQRRRPGRAARRHTQANVATILDALLDRLPADRIVTVAIPDYTVTPAGADYGDPRQQHDGDRGRATRPWPGSRPSVGSPNVDIFDLSLRAADGRSLVADDGLHPSGAQYALWVGRIVPVVEGLIGRTASG